MKQTERSLKRYALYLLGRRAYATLEIKSKLMDKLSAGDVDENDQDPGLVDRVITYLVALNLLDDEAYAKTYSISLERRGKSARYISQKLMQKGISKELIRSLTHNPTHEFDAITHIIELHTRRSPEILKSPQGRAKLTRHLAYRGFQFNDIRKAIDDFSTNHEL